VKAYNVAQEYKNFFSIFLASRYYKKLHNKMYETGNMPTEATAAIEVYKW
jgi:hypothetical protein